MRDLAALAAGLIPMAACVGAVHRENAALRMSWPTGGANRLAAGEPARPYPSVDGDILKGTSPQELAAARAAASAALAQSLAKP
jgi:hypothetical protein